MKTITKPAATLGGTLVTGAAFAAEHSDDFGLGRLDFRFSF